MWKYRSLRWAMLASGTLFGFGLGFGGCGENPLILIGAALGALLLLPGLGT